MRSPGRAGAPRIGRGSRWLGALLATTLFLESCNFGPPQGAPSIFSAESNVAYAVSAICAPFVLDKAEATALPIQQGLVRIDGWTEPGFRDASVQPVRVGFAGFVHVAVSQNGPKRQCDIIARRGDPQALRRAALRALAARPDRFAPTRSRYLPGRFATEDALCADPDSHNPGGFVLLSSPPPGVYQVTMLLTMFDNGERMPSCDRAGVPMNYRTLAGP